METDVELRSVPGYPHYSVGSNGQVYSETSGRFLKQLRVPNGYRHVVLCGSEKKRFAVHHLVAITWIGEKIGNQVINHKDGDKSNNNAANLEWVSQSENAIHAYQNGLRVIGVKHRRSAAATGRARRSFTDDQMIAIKNEFDGKRGRITELAKKHGISRYAVRSAIEANL